MKKRLRKWFLILHSILTYVYDELTGKYILCGLLDAAEAVDAVTGEIISLGDL